MHKLLTPMKEHTKNFFIHTNDNRIAKPTDRYISVLLYMYL